jgi:hypothetical protein
MSETANGVMFQGVNCVWIGERSQVSASGNCPFCSGELKEVPTFWADVDAVERGEYSWPTYKKTAQPADWKPQPHPGYRAMWEWASKQQRCFKHIAHLHNSYLKHTGTYVGIEP